MEKLNLYIDAWQDGTGWVYDPAKILFNVGVIDPALLEKLKSSLDEVNTGMIVLPAAPYICVVTLSFVIHESVMKVYDLRERPSKARMESDHADNTEIWLQILSASDEILTKNEIDEQFGLVLGNIPAEHLKVRV
ncbi:MAG TPA: hypothetical protein VEB63_00320 [Chitinophagaceae bacterium]|nr:hypothetical protein [Chitinophagaceae bacterium]